MGGDSSGSGSLLPSVRQLLLALHLLCAKSDGRDRIARVGLFASKFLRGVLKERIKGKDDPSDWGKPSSPRELDKPVVVSSGGVAVGLEGTQGGECDGADRGGGAASRREGWRQVHVPPPSGPPHYVVPKGKTFTHRLLERAEQQHEIYLEARRTFRFFKVVVVLLSIGRIHERNMVEMLLHSLNKLFWAVFFGSDSVFWVYKHLRLCSKKRLRWIKRFSFTSLSFGNFFGFVYHTIRLLDPTVRTRKGGGLAWRAVLLCVRSAALTVQASHMGEFILTHDAVIGALGVFTSIFDLYFLWPGAGAMAVVDGNAAILL
jgi:hypothetical protein